MNWQQVQQQAWLCFNRAAHFWLVQTLIFYMWACVIAEKPIGPTNFIRFSYHVIQWRPGGVEPTRTDFQVDEGR